MKTLKISSDVHEKLKIFCVKFPENMTEFADAAILMRLEYFKNLDQNGGKKVKQPHNKQSKKP